MPTVDAIVRESISSQSGDQLERFVLTHASDLSTQCTIYCYGAHITQWNILGNKILYCSESAVYEIGKGIRGMLYSTIEI